MTLATGLERLTQDLNSAQQQVLQKGDIVLTGQNGTYHVYTLVQAPLKTVWDVLTAYEQFPAFLPSVVKARVLQRTDNRIVVERCDRRKVGWMPLTVKLTTENVEFPPTRIDYRMVNGTLDTMEGSWHLSDSDAGTTLLLQKIAATAKLGPLQSYFYEVFEQGLKETFSDLRKEMERRAASW